MFGKLFGELCVSLWGYAGEIGGELGQNFGRLLRDVWNIFGGFMGCSFMMFEIFLDDDCNIF